MSFQGRKGYYRSAARYGAFFITGVTNNLTPDIVIINLAAVSASYLCTRLFMVTIITVTAIILLVLRTHTSEQIQKGKSITRELRASAAKYCIDLETVLARNHWAIALDKDNLRLLYVTYKAQKLTTILIDLHEIERCQILKTYTTPRRFLSLQRPHKRRLRCILLEIKHTDSSSSHQIPFYNHAHDKVADMKMLFQNARHWQRMIVALK